MKHNIKSYFAASAFLLLAAGCTSDDDFGRIPEGGIPLSIGRVGVAGVETVDASSRAATTEDASGFTGIRKSTFVNGDALSLVLSDDGGTTTTTVTATLTGGQWALNPAKNFVIPGTTTIKATYTPTATSGMKADNLEATTYTLDGQKVTFAMKHVNALLDITYTASVAPASMTVTANNGTADETLSTALEEEADGSKHFRAIASPGTVKSLTAVINGQNYIATLATPLTVEANKRYPIALTFKENALTATVGTATLNWTTGGTGGLFAPGYDYYIGTPEDLAQFAYDVNNDLNGARTARVFQTANIDLARLKAADPAKSYTATADNWVPIADSNSEGTDSFAFSGTYNGNGHTVSNMKISSNSSAGAGFFGSVNGATLTGIHLRDVLINFPSGTNKDCASLCVYARNTTISLCSATGDITYYGSGNGWASGGLIGTAMNGSAVTRCSCNVNINSNDPLTYQYVGGFAGIVGGSFVAGCSSNGNIITKGNDADYLMFTGGFVGDIGINTEIFGCSSAGELEGGQIGCFHSNQSSSKELTMWVKSCYSTCTVVGGTNDFVKYAGDVSYTDCAMTGTKNTAITGVTGDVAEADIYATITDGRLWTGAAIKTLHWSAADGYTTTEVSDRWNALVVWKDNGTAAPTIDMTYEGGAPMYNGKESNLLALTDQAAFWVAPENAMTSVEWTAIDFNTVCPEGWHVPTYDEFIAMGCPGSSMPDPEKQAIVSVAFPVGSYWASTAETELRAKRMTVSADNVTVGSVEKTSLYNVRCVRK